MLLEYVNIQPQLISVCSENRLNPTVILLLPVCSQAVGRHLCPGQVSVSPHPAHRQRPTERAHSLPQKPHLQQSHSHVSICGLHACADVGKGASKGVCSHVLFRVTLRSTEAEVCLDPEAPMGRRLIRCWRR